MKVISYELGRIIVLFPFEEIRPNGGLYAPLAFEAFRDRYGFVGLPKLGRTREEVDREGVRFQQGHINLDGREISISELAIFVDGVVIDCTQTANSLVVWDELISWVVEELGFKPPFSDLKIHYKSTIIVQFEKRMNKMINKFSSLSKMYADFLQKYSPHERQEIDMVSVSLGSDVGRSTDIIKPSPLNIERRAGIGFDKERYFCEASLPSEQLEELLVTIENML